MVQFRLFSHAETLSYSVLTLLSALSVLLCPVQQRQCVWVWYRSS